ncbi:ABC transporter substrate-binding protein [Methylobacterium oryzae]|uniref:ABC transporter substrate-binding protein n=1 Tax=Methylobacterium oryzae TaxID=334852 RepID=A0ABU7TLR0_9HYPH
MKRRQFLAAGVAYAAGFSCLSVSALENKLFRLALIHPSRPVEQMTRQGSPFYRAMFLELEKLGFIEGKNLEIARYSALGSREALQKIVHEAALRNPDAILASSGRTVLMLKQETQTVPVVGFVSDPISYGIVNSIAHPGGNITGVIVDGGIETWQKRLELLRAAKPSIKSIFHVAPRSASESRVGVAINDAARNVGLTLVGPPVESPHQAAEYQRAFSEAESSDACLINAAPENLTARKLICELITEKRLLAMAPYREFAVDGCAMSYDFNLIDLNTYAAHQVASIFQGTNPGEIPFYQPKNFNFVINSSAMERLGLTLDANVLARADEVL